MKELIIITKSVDDAYKLCFRIGINSSDSMPITCFEDTEHVGEEGFFTILYPLPEDAVSILDFMRSKRFIKVEFNEYGKSDALEQMAGQLKFELRRYKGQLITEYIVKNVSDRIDEFIRSYLPENNYPDVKFRVLIDNSGSLTLAPDTSSAKCLTNLMRRYLNEQL